MTSSLIDIDDLGNKNAEVENNSQVSESAETPKRKRGRPRKNASAGATAKAKKSQKTTRRNSRAYPHTIASKKTDKEDEYERPSTGKRISNSVFNLFLFAMIFAALVSA